MISRREFILGSAAVALTSRAAGTVAQTPELPLVNDVHSQLNPTRVLNVLQPRTLEAVQNIVRTAAKHRQVISVAGGRHAMGGQQFGAGTLLIDIRKMNRVLHLDRDRGILEVEAGIEWPELINDYINLQSADAKPWGIAQNLQSADAKPWGIAQKQTGADRFTIAGTMAANAHGRGLKMKPFISDVESFLLVDATGRPIPAVEPRMPNCFAWYTVGTGSLEWSHPHDCDSCPE